VEREDPEDTEGRESEETGDSEVSSAAEEDTFKLEFVRILRVVHPKTLETPRIRLPFSSWFETTAV
jgi:hypothetical protein